MGWSRRRSKEGEGGNRVSEVIEGGGERRRRVTRKKTTREAEEGRQSRAF
jgi:hypothetical protein